MGANGDTRVHNSPVSSRDHELWAMASIQSQMPVVFAEGAEWTHLEGHCAACQHVLSGEDLRGSVRRPLTSLAEVEAVGLCEDCRLLTRFFYRLHSDMRMTGPTARGWQEWRARPSVADRLRSAGSALNGFVKHLLDRPRS